MRLWLLFCAIGAITFAMRLSFIYLHGKASFPAWFRLSLQYVPASVLAALTLPGLAMLHDSLDISFTNPRLIAGGIAALVAWRTRDVLATTVAGMASLWLLQWLFSKFA
jgi:branched-subunit amino acid transport protein